MKKTTSLVSEEELGGDLPVHFAADSSVPLNAVAGNAQGSAHRCSKQTLVKLQGLTLALNWKTNAKNMLEMLKRSTHNSGIPRLW